MEDYKVRDKIRHISLFLMGFWFVYLLAPIVYQSLFDPCATNGDCCSQPPKEGKALDANAPKICCDVKPPAKSENSPNFTYLITNQKEFRQPYLASEFFKFQPFIQTSYNSAELFSRYTSSKFSFAVSRSPPSNLI